MRQPPHARNRRRSAWSIGDGSGGREQGSQRGGRVRLHEHGAELEEETQPHGNLLERDMPTPPCRFDLSLPSCRGCGEPVSLRCQALDIPSDPGTFGPYFFLAGAFGAALPGAGFDAGGGAGGFGAAVTGLGLGGGLGADGLSVVADAGGAGPAEGGSAADGAARGGGGV